MYKIGDYIVYKKDVCIVKNIKNNHINGMDYYVLTPVDDETLKIDVPTVSNEYIRDLISKDKIEKIINSIPKIDIIESNDKLMESEYKLKMSSGKYEDLISIIKTAYLRNEERKNAKKKISEKDDYYLNRAEKYLYTEFSIVLGKSYDETKRYIIEKAKELEN